MRVKNFLYLGFLRSAQRQVNFLSASAPLLLTYELKHVLWLIGSCARQKSRLSHFAVTVVVSHTNANQKVSPFNFKTFILLFFCKISKSFRESNTVCYEEAQVSTVSYLTHSKVHGKSLKSQTGLDTEMCQAACKNRGFSSKSVGNVAKPTSLSLALTSNVAAAWTEATLGKRWLASSAVHI